MAERPSIYNPAIWGAESVIGTQVVANKRLLATNVDLNPNTPTIPYRPAGNLSPTTAIAQKEWTVGPITGAISYNDLIYLYSGCLKTGVVSTPAGATNTRRWTFKPGQFSPDVPVTFTIDHGSAVGAERITGGAVESLTHRWTRTEANLTGQLTGQVTQEQVQGTLAVATDIQPLPIDPKTVSLFAGSSFSTNQVQTVTVNGVPTGGTFTLSLDTQTTANIAFNALASVVQTALTALPNINTNGVTVTGAAGGPYTVTFGGSLAGLNVDTLVGNGALLTGGASPTVTAANTTPGSMTKLLRASSFEFVIPTRYSYGFTLDDGVPSWSYLVQMGIEPNATLVLEHESVSAGFMATLRAKTTNYFCLLARGPAIEAGFVSTLRLFFPFKFIESSRGDVDNVYASTWKLNTMYDSTYGGFMEANVDTSLATL